MSAIKPDEGMVPASKVNESTGDIDLKYRGIYNNHYKKL